MHFQRDNTLILPVNCDILHVMFSFLNFSLTADGWPSGENQERVSTSVIPELKIVGFYSPCSDRQTRLYHSECYIFLRKGNETTDVLA